MKLKVLFLNKFDKESAEKYLAIMRTDGARFENRVQKLYQERNEHGNFGALKLDQKRIAKLSKVLMETEIRSLNLYGTGMNSSWVEQLKSLKLSKLHTLNLNCNSLFDAGLSILLLNLPLTLSNLNLCNNGITEDGAFFLAEFLRRNPLLIHLDVSFNAIRSSGAIALLNSLVNNTHLYRLNLHRNSINEEIQNSLMKLMSNNKRLVHLKLEYNPLTASTLSKVRDFGTKNKLLEVTERSNLAIQFIRTRKLLLLRHQIPLEVLIIVSSLESRNIQVASMLLDRDTIGKILTTFEFSPSNLIRQVGLLKQGVAV
jgi:hypothetical protein